MQEELGRGQGAVALGQHQVGAAGEQGHHLRQGYLGAGRIAQGQQPGPHQGGGLGARQGQTVGVAARLVGQQAGVVAVLHVGHAVAPAPQLSRQRL